MCPKEMLSGIHVKFQRGIGEIFPSFQRGLWKMYRIYRKIHHADEGDFKLSVKSGEFLKMREVSHVCSGTVWSGSTLLHQTCLSENLGVLQYWQDFFPHKFPVVCWYFNKSSSQRQGNKLEFYVCVLQKHKEQSVHFSPEPLYNTVHYDMVLQNR